MLNILKTINYIFTFAALGFVTIWFLYYIGNTAWQYLRFVYWMKWSVNKLVEQGYTEDEAKETMVNWKNSNLKKNLRYVGISFGVCTICYVILVGAVL